MSTEKQKNDELNEQELWDLLKDPEPTEMPKKKAKKQKKPAKPAQASQPAEKTESKPKTVITEKRKKALVWYLAGLFGIAFVVVLISLLMRGTPGTNPNQPTGEDSIQIQELYDRINDLEEENSALTEEKAELEEQATALQGKIQEQQEMLDGLKVLNDELSASIEYVEGNSLYKDENAEKLAKTMNAYQLLVRAQNAYIDENVDVLDEAMAELEGCLDLLSQEALNAYYMVIEYMEQPYLGQE